MEQIIITKADGTTWPLLTKAAVSTVTKATQKRALLGEDIIDMSISSAVPLIFNLGDHIIVFGNTYTLNSLPKFQKAGSRSYIYDLTWEGRQYDMLKALYMAESEDGISISPDWSLAGDLNTFIDILVNNLNRVNGYGKWVKGDCPATDTKILTFSNENCLAVLQNLCSEDNYNKEFEIIESGGVCTLNIKDAIGQNLLQTYKYGRGKGLYNLTRQTVSDKNIITRLYVFGSDKNLPSDYRGYAQRLKLPGNDKSYIEDDEAVAAFGLIEGVKIFDDVFPRRTGTISSLGASVYEFTDNSMDFDLNATDSQGNTIYLLNKTLAKIHFNTGKLAGYELEASYDHSTKKFTVKSFADERGQAFPDPDSAAFQLAVGDEYVIVDIIMPQSYITNAESDLQTAGAPYYDQNSQPRVQYSLTFDQLYLKGLNPGPSIVNLFGIGDYLNVQDSDINVDKAIRIKSFSRDLIEYYNYTLDLSDIKEPATLQRILASNIETEKILAINKLRDVARAKRNWKSIGEVYDMIFDPDGYFDGTRIKPETIETLMLIVGAKSQIFSLDCIIEPNYEGNPNIINVNAGTLSHFGIEDNPRDWAIATGATTLTDPGAYYSYAKCAKVGSAGFIFFSQNQIKFDDDANYYHFLVGVIHAAQDGVRWISLTYGATVINGKFIRTGRIASLDGLTYFDLDAGEIGGKIKFQSGKYDNEIEGDITDALDLANTAGENAESAVNAASAAAIDSGNALTIANSAAANASSALGEISAIVSDSILSKNEKPTIKLDYDTIIAEKSGIDAKATSYGITTEKNAYDAAVTALTSYLTGLNPAYTDFNQDTVVVGADFRNNFLTVYTARQTLLNKIYSMTLDTTNAAVANAHRIRTQTVIDAGIITTGRLEVGSGNLGDANAWINGSVNPNDPDNDYRFGAGASYANRANAVFFVKNNGDMISKGVIEFGTKAVSVGSILQNLAIKGTDIWENYADADGSAVCINIKGFNGGTTRYRDCIIYDGKGHKLFAVSGATPAIYIGNTIDPMNVLLDITGSLNLNGNAIRAASNHQIVTGTNDITCGSSEGDMTSMSITYTPRGTKAFVMFSAPFYVSSTNQTLYLYINIGGSNVRKARHYITSGFNQISFQHLATVTPGTSYTIKIRWSGGTSIQQRGSTDSERILTIIDLI
jgi:hypothetical protein